MGDGPWSNYSAPQPAAAPEEDGPWTQHQASDAAPAPAQPVHTATSPDQTASNFIAGMHSLSENPKGAATADDVRNYISAHGHVVTPELDRWLNEQYDPAQKGNPGKPLSVDWQTTAPHIQGSEGGSLLAGLEHGALAGFDDRVAAAGGWLGSRIAGTDKPYSQILDEEQQARHQAADDNPVSYGIGNLGGALIGPKGFGVGKLGAVGNAAVRGAQVGALNAVGNTADLSDLGQDASNAAAGATVGAGLGAAGHFILGKVGGAAAALGRKLGVGGTDPNSGLTVLSVHAPQDAVAMSQKAAQLRAAGVQPRLVDVVDDQGRRMIALAATDKQAANIVTPHVNSQYAQTPYRIANQATGLGDAAGPPANTAARAVASDAEQANKDLGPSFDAVRDSPLTVDGPMADVFRTKSGQTALARVAKDLGPEDSDKLIGLVKQLRTANSGAAADVPADPYSGKTFNVGGRQMAYDTAPPALQKAIQQAYPAAAKATEGGAAPQMTVDQADRIARELYKQAQSSGNPGALYKMMNTIRGAARDQYPDYDEAVRNVGQVKTVQNAAAGTGDYESSNLMTTPQDKFAQTVDQASPAKPSAMTTDEETGDRVPVDLPSPRQALQAQGRQQITDAANSGARGALGVARNLTQAPTAQANAESLFGQSSAERLRAGMAAELERVQNTRQIDPNTGSKTSMRLMDDNDVNDLANIISAGAHAATGGVGMAAARLARTAGNWLGRAGIRGVDAQRLVRAAVSNDPDQLQQSISFLGSKGVPTSAAAKIMDTIKSGYAGPGSKALAALAGQAAGTPAKPVAPNSVRAVMRSTQP